MQSSDSPIIRMAPQMAYTLEVPFIAPVLGSTLTMLICTEAWSLAWMIRLLVELFTHRKTKTLIRLLGFADVWGYGDFWWKYKFYLVWKPTYWPEWLEEEYKMFGYHNFQRINTFFLGKGVCDSNYATEKHTRGDTYHLRGQYKSTNCPASFSISIYCNEEG